MPSKRAPTKPTERALRMELRQAELSLALEEARYATGLLRRLGEDASTSGAVVRDDTTEERGKWAVLSSGSTVLTDKEGTRDLATVRRECYRAWRYDSYARGILRTFVKFIIGRGWGLDFADTRRGRWAGVPGASALVETEDLDDSLLVALAWKAFGKRTQFLSRAKELVLRTFRDGEMFLRRFSSPAGLALRFIEPGQVQSTRVDGTVLPEDIEKNPALATLLGTKTKIQDGIEHLKDDVETVVAYHVDGTRVPAPEIIHLKALADTNDLRGIPLLEVVLKRLTNYNQWEEYRLILNKVRTAITLVRKIEGTSAQAAANIAGRGSARSAPGGREPQTTSGTREVMFRSGTVLNASPGISYEFLSPKLEAADAAQDGKRFLLSVAVGVGLPEMLVTGSWENNNYASSVTARDPAVREWEDWQDLFEPVFVQVFEWVVEDSIRLWGLPEDVDRGVDVQWPPIISADAAKETERNVMLNAAGVMSKKTWAAKEDLLYDDEQENLRQEQEETGGAMDSADTGTDGELPEDAAEARTVALSALAELEEWAEAPDADVDDAARRRRVREFSGAVRTWLTALDEARPVGSEVQSLIFAKASFKTAAAAKAWAKTHDFHSGKVDETEGSFRLRQRDPEEFEDKMWTIRLTKGVKAVIGRPKGG